MFHNRSKDVSTRKTKNNKKTGQAKKQDKDNKDNKPPSPLKRIFGIAAGVLVAVALMRGCQSVQSENVQKPESANWSTLVGMAEDGKIERLEVVDNKITAYEALAGEGDDEQQKPDLGLQAGDNSQNDTTSDENSAEAEDKNTKTSKTSKNSKTKAKKFSVIGPSDHQAILDELSDDVENIEFKNAPEPFPFHYLFYGGIIVIFLLMYRNQQKAMSGQGGPMAGHKKSKLQRIGEDQNTTTFEDIAGCEEAKEDVQETIEFLSGNSKFDDVDAEIPKGILLVGPPGTGKTLLAKAIAGEANVPFFSTSGSDFVEMFVGVGASRVRDMFEEARKNAPAILFIDEFDALAKTRGGGSSGASNNDEREQTLNALLVEMDGMNTDPTKPVIIIAATNRPEILDPAIKRPGRFDRQVTVDAPDVKGRRAILEVHLRNKQLDLDVNLDRIARATTQMTGAYLKSVCNEAAIFAARNGRKVLKQDDFEKARDKVNMGAELKSRTLSKQDLVALAYHEAGHAIMTILGEEYGNEFHKLTIVPRSKALGVSFSLPRDDTIMTSEIECISHIRTTAGGRVAEELVFGKPHECTGASNDIEQATNMADKMVTEWGMSDELGFVRYTSGVGMGAGGYLGGGSARAPMAEETKAKIDAEKKRIVTEAYEFTKACLTENIECLHMLVEALLEHETLDAEDVKALIGDQLVKPNDPILEAHKNTQKFMPPQAIYNNLDKLRP